MWALEPSLLDLLSGKLQPVETLRRILRSHPALLLVSPTKFFGNDRVNSKMFLVSRKLSTRCRGLLISVGSAKSIGKSGTTANIVQ